MRQITQVLRDGKMQVIEVPVPKLRVGTIMVKNFYSLISVGTEGSTVKAARKSLIGKAKERPQQAKQVLEHLKSQGPMATYRAVMKKLDAFSPLGYSCVGEVIDVASDVTSFKVGDFAACGGLSASHAEVVVVAANLCVKIPKDTDLKQSAYNTMGAIALQGVRQADLRIGESCAVIGMGLLGHLTCLLLRAGGVQVVGLDIDQRMVDLATVHCADLALNRRHGSIEAAIRQFTGGIGCDAVIIAAAAASLDPINFAGAIARNRGTVVVVGNVPTGFDREPYFYQKELQVRMSCSYGPGRYDFIYEEKGIDYPPAFARWTENRNMQAFQHLIYSKKIDVSYLTTHVFKLEDAPKAYDMMMAKTKPFAGILIEYNHKKELQSEKIIIKSKAIRRRTQRISIGFIGAGSYAQGHLLPNIPKSKDINLIGIMTASSTSSRSAGERFGFEFCTNNADDIIKNDDINTLFITSRHDSHAEYTLKAIKAGKHVFVEKPLIITESDLDQIVDWNNTQNLNEASSKINQPINHSTNKPILMVGFNRRFSPLALELKGKLKEGPMAMIYRVNAGYIPADSWIQDPDIGGGRIIGEVCHFIDFLTFINGSLPVSVYAISMTSAGNFNDTLNVSLSYRNGSVGTISYFANGDKSLPKERVEIFSQGTVAVIDDFRNLVIHSNGKKKAKKLLSQNKGQKNEVASFINAVMNGKRSPISFDDIYYTSKATLKIIESIRKGDKISLG